MCAAQEDEKFMRRALELAKKGEGWVSPNPMVGAVIVKDGRIIGEGWHAGKDGMKSMVSSMRKETLWLTASSRQKTGSCM